MSKSAFEIANENHEREKDRAESGGFTRDYDDVHYLGLKNKQKTSNFLSVFRILSDPVYADRKPTDCRFVFRSQVATDKEDGSYIELNWPQELDSEGRETGNIDKKWILYRLWEAITKGEWKKDAEGKNKKIYNYAGTSALIRILDNKIHNFTQDFKGKPRAMMNVLDRMDLDFHRQNKKSKSLATRHEAWDKSPDPNNPIMFTTKGLPYVVSKNASGFYDILWDRVAGVRGDWDIDIIAWLDGMRYEILDATDVLDSRKYDEALKAIVSDQPLEDEFKDLEMYDFNKLFPYSSFNKLKKHLSGLFTAVDGVCGTKFHDELLELAYKEDAENKAKRAAQKTDAKPESDPEPPKTDEQEATSVNRNNGSEQVNQEPEKQPEPQPEPEPEKQPEQVQSQRQPERVQEEPPKQETTPPQQENSLENECKQKFPKWDELPENDKNILLSTIDSFAPNGLINWKAEYQRSNIYPCSESTCKLPGTNSASAYPKEVSMCPVCGVKFKMD